MSQGCAFTRLLSSTPSLRSSPCPLCQRFDSEKKITRRQSYVGLSAYFMEGGNTSFYGLVRNRIEVAVEEAAIG